MTEDQISILKGAIDAHPAQFIRGITYDHEGTKHLTLTVTYFDNHGKLWQSTDVYDPDGFTTYNRNVELQTHVAEKLTGIWSPE